MDASTRLAVRERAGGRCEYCHLPESAVEVPFHIEHVIARQHGGVSELSNLALSCDRCNLFKGPNLAALDPESDSLVRLFNPRQDQWSEHFRWRLAVAEGITPTGRATVRLLRMNDPGRIRLREELGLPDAGEA